MKKIAVIGSSGSIGQSTLSVIRSLPKQFKVVALAVNRDIVKLKQQIEEFRPRLVCVKDKTAAFKLKTQVGSLTKVLSGDEGLDELVADKEIAQIMLAVSGSAALRPLITAIKSGKDIALANKEALVMAGPIIMRLADKHKVKILPVDSEQSAIWQSLLGADSASVRKVYLTASGGALRNLPANKFKQVSIEKVLAHPRWKMGKRLPLIPPPS